MKIHPSTQDAAGLRDGLWKCESPGWNSLGEEQEWWDNGMQSNKLGELFHHNVSDLLTCSAFFFVVFIFRLLPWNLWNRLYLWSKRVQKQGLLWAFLHVLWICAPVPLRRRRGVKNVDCLLLKLWGRPRLCGQMTVYLTTSFRAQEISQEVG